jgi:hypothetical protein
MALYENIRVTPYAILTLPSRESNFMSVKKRLMFLSVYFQPVVIVLNFVNRIF